MLILPIAATSVEKVFFEMTWCYIIIFRNPRLSGVPTVYMLSTVKKNESAKNI